MHRQIDKLAILFLLILCLSLGGYPIGRPDGKPSPRVEQNSQARPATKIAGKTINSTPSQSPESTTGIDPEGGAILIGQRIAGILDGNSDVDVHQFHGVAGESVRIEANATTGDLDPTVTLFVDPALRTSGNGAHSGAASGFQMDAESLREAREAAEEPRAGPSQPEKSAGELSGSPGARPVERVGLVAANSVVVASPDATQAYSTGDVFCAVGNGKVKRFSPTGTLLQTLDSGSNSQFTAGMAFDSSGSVFVTQFSSDNVFKFDINGNLIGPFGSGYNLRPESAVVDAAQNVYVGQADGSRVVRKFNASGSLLDTFAPATEARGTDWIDLAADQRTLFYTSEGKKVKRFDLVTKTQLADFNSVDLPGSFAYALRVLPGGGVLVADNETIVRLNAAGVIVQQYDAPNEDVWFAVNLDPDGQTFWSGNLTTGMVYRFNIATGAVVTSWDSGRFTALGGLAVFGEITAAQVLSISKSAPTTAKPGEQLTYTITFGNSGLSNVTNVVIKDPLPTGVSFVSATDGGTLVNGVLTWNIGTLNAGVTGRTVSFTVKAGASGNIVNRNYTIEATGIAPIGGPPVTTNILQIIHDDNSGGGVNALIKVFQLPFTGSYRVVVASARSASSGGYELALLPIDNDSNKAATQVGGSSPFAKVWNTKTNNSLVFSASVTSTPVTFQEFSPDGESVAMQVGGTSPFVRVYNTRTGTVIFTDSVTSTPVILMGFAPDGASVATQVEGSTPFVKVWSTRSNNSLIFQDSITGTGAAFAGFAPDGASAAVQVGGTTPFVKVWSTRSNNSLIFTDSVTSTPVTFAGFAPDGSSAADQVGGTTPFVKVWSTRSNNSLTFTDSVTSTPVTFAGFAPDGSSAADQVGGTSPFVKVWRTRSSNSLVFTDSVTSTPVTFAGFAPDGSSAADQVGGTSPFVKVWSTRSSNSLTFTDSVTSTPVTFAGFAPDGATAADQVGGSSPFVKVWSTRSGNSLTFTDSVTSTPVTFAGFAPDGVSVADQVGGTAPFVKVWNTRSGTLILTDSVTSTPVTLMSFAPNGASVATQVGTTTSSVKVWSTRASNSLIFQDSITGTGAAFAGFGPDGASAAVQVGGTNPFVKVWSIRSGTLIFTDSVTGTPVLFAGFAPDGSSVADQVGGSSPFVKVWNTRSSNSLIFTDSVTSTPVTFAGFAPDGTSAADQVGGSSPFVKVWSTRSNNSLIFTDSVTSTPVTFAGFSLDSDGVADQVGGSSPFVKVWSTRSNNSLIFTDSVTSTPVAFAAFSFDRTHGTLPAAPSIEVSSLFLDFGNVAVGQSKDLTLTIRNTGNAELTINSFSLSASQFTVASPSAPFNIAAAAQQVVNVRFTPTNASVQTGTLAIASNDPNRPGIDVLLAGNGPGCVPRLSNLVAWYPGDGNANDAQGSNNATLQNGATFTTGMVGQAFNLDGSNDSVLTPTINLGNQFSVELWIRPTASGTFQHVVSNGLSSTNYGALYFHNDHLQYWQGGSPRVSSGAIPLNAFSHVTLTYDGNVARLFVGGTLAGTSGAHAENYNNAVMFGFAIQSEANHFAGQIDEVSLYNRALSGTEIQAIVSAGPAGKCKQLAAGPILDVTPTTLDFGDVAVGQNKDLPLTVRNTGTATLTVNSFNINNPQFSVTSPAVPFNVAAGGQQAVNVRFTPTSGPPQTANLTINSNDPNSTGLNVVLLGTPTGGPGPANNNFANAQVISGASGNVTGSNVGANKESGEPNHAGNAGGHSVWYRWQAVASGTVTFATAGSNFDTLLAVYTGSSVGTLTEIGSDDDVSTSDLTSSVTFNAVSGIVYQIAVDGFGGATGNITLNWSPGGSSGNNVPLTSGVPQAGSLPAPDPGEGLLGLTQYTIPVPTGATQLKVDLSGNQDVDLYVRFNQRIGIANGTVVADYASESFTGTESITVTPSSLPPLQQGAYFIAVANFGPGAANFTVTATVTGGQSSSTKTGVFRPSTGELFLKNSNSSGFADTYIIFGNPGDYPIAGDWNGDGIDSVGIYRNGVFYLRNSNTTGFADIVVTFGSPTDQPVVGDWNGDGVDTIGVYRNGTFILRNSNTGGAPDLIFTLGDPGDVAIAGDWNGDGIVTGGVFRPSNGIVYLKNSNTTGFADIAFVFGNAGDKPVAGDWNGDGVDTIGIYRGGLFFLSNSNTTGFADIVFVLGNSGDFPIAGNWNGSP